MQFLVRLQYEANHAIPLLTSSMDLQEYVGRNFHSMRKSPKMMGMEKFEFFSHLNFFFALFVMHNLENMGYKIFRGNPLPKAGRKGKFL
jgi:hypothetical protein